MEIGGNQSALPTLFAVLSSYLLGWKKGQKKVKGAKEKEECAPMTTRQFTKRKEKGNEKPRPEGNELLLLLQSFPIHEIEVQIYVFID